MASNRHEMSPCVCASKCDDYSSKWASLDLALNRLCRLFKRKGLGYDRINLTRPEKINDYFLCFCPSRSLIVERQEAL